MSGNSIFERDTLVSVLRNNSGGSGIIFINNAANEFFLSYEELHKRALSVLNNLQEKGLTKGAELIIQVEDNQTFLIAFWACLLGKIIPVPLSVGIQDDQKLKILKIWKILNNPFLLTDQSNLDRIDKYGSEMDLESLIPDIKGKTIIISELSEIGKPGIVEDAQPEDIAYIQFSSGSTGEPKGVILTHENLIYNTSDIASRSEISAIDSMLSWMPLTHDMGLICFHLTGVISGINQYIMPTSLFIRRPVLWIEKASEHKATLLYSPNFGYQYFLDSFEGYAGDGLDLSGIRLIYNGAEPISEKLCKRFCSQLLPYGLNKQSIFPGYGLAEASVAVTLPRVGSDLVVYRLNRTYLNIGDELVEVEEDDTNGVAFVEVGYPIDNCAVRICDNDGIALKEDLIGHIQIKGKNVTKGYYNNAQAGREIITEDGWLKTGDLGFIKKGNLIITGRAKNIIIINGQNYYPQDIERVAEDLPEVGIGKIVACGIRDEVQDKDLLIVFVLYKRQLQHFIPLLAKLRQLISERVGLLADHIIPIQKIPKTTSGKIQYYKLVEEYKAGSFNKGLNEIKKLLYELNKVQSDEDLSTESRLTNIWAGLSGKIVEAEDSLIEQGLNSLKAVQFIARVNEIFDITLTIREIFKHRTIKSISDFIDGTAKNTSISKVKAISCIPKQEFYPVSESQKRFWVLDQFKERKSAFNISTAYLLEGDLNVSVLLDAFDALAARHESLRTVFVEVNGAPKQIVLNVLPLEYKIFQDLKSESISSESLKKIIDQEANTPFYLDKGPLFRVRIFRIAELQYALVITIHHIVADGWSIGVIYREIEALYRANIEGKKDILPLLPIQLKDCLEWKKEQLTQDKRAEQRNYWLNKLKDRPSNQYLPTSKNATGNSSKAENIRVLFSSEKLKKLKEIAGNQDASLFMVLIAALNVVFYKYSGQTDIIVGIDTAGRTHKDLENQIGYYLNTLIIRTQFAFNDTFAHLIDAVKDLILEAHDHQQYPFDTLVEDLHLNRSIEHVPIFNTLVLLQNFETINLSFGDDIKATPLEPVLDLTLIDLQLEFVEKEDVLQLDLKYNKDLYGSNLVRKFAGHFENLVDVLILEEHLPVWQYQLMAEAEKDMILSFNQPTEKPVDHKTFVELFESQVVKTPDSVAIVFNHQSFSYKEINEQANRLARYFRAACNLQPEDRVGLLLEKSEHVIISILAVLKAGVAFVPIDPDFPSTRIRYILENSNAKVLYTDEQAIKSLTADAGVKILLCDAIADALGEYESSNLQPAHTSENLAYILYTSGSTGKPKGVMIEHHSLVDYALTVINYFVLSHEDIVLHQSSLGFDVIIEEIFPILLVSGRLVIHPKSNRDIDELRSSILNHNITVLSSTPLVIAELNKKPADLQSLRIIISGGDELREAYISNIFKSLPQVGIYNTYGPTESTVCASYYKVADLSQTTLLGKPIRNREIYIVDHHLNLMPVGIPGEICIGGEGLARGYVNQDDETFNRFVANPFKEGERLYKTGDWGRWLEDGNIEFLGRRDEQVKIRGYRIELSEIEHALLAHPQIQNVVIAIKEGSSGLKYLVAYFISENVISSHDLKGFLYRHLPEFMIPSHFIKLASFPLTSNGSKVDKRALPHPEEVEAIEEIDGTHQKPANETESWLIDVWKEVLQRDSIGMLDNFFELGGHSLKATQIISRINKFYKVEIELKDIFLNPTVKHLAQVLASAAKLVYEDIEPIAVQEDYEVSHAQRRLWILDQFDGNQTAYNLSWALRLEGNLYRNELDLAFKTLIRRHESLRTYFVSVNEEPRQKITDEEGFDFKIKYIDLRREEKALSIAEKLALEASTTPFDLQRGPLLKAQLLHIHSQEYIFIFTMHHIISDAWSMDILVEELVAFYNSYVGGKEIVLPDLKIQYNDYAQWQNRLLEKESIREQRNYWVNQFEDEVPVLSLQTDFPRPAIQAFNGDSIEFEIEAGTKMALVDLGTRHSASLFMTLLTLVKALLYKYTGQEDMVIGTPVAGRNHKDLEDQIGFYVNTLALRTRFKGEESFEQLLQEVAAITLNAYKNQLYPFDKLVDDLNLERDMSRSALFDVMVGLRHEKGDLNLMDQITISPFDTPTVITQFDLSFDFVVKEEDILVKIEYNKELFSKSRIAQTAIHFKKLADSVILNASGLLCDLEYIPTEEYRKLVFEFNNTRADYPRHLTLKEAFEDQVKMTPDAIAVTFNNTSLTYNEVNISANKMAHYLKENYPIGPETKVSLMVGRSEWMVIVIIGIVKAGAAYLPIDPEYPLERIKYIIEDSGTDLLITDQSFFSSKNSDLDILILEEAKDMMTAFSSENLPTEISQANLAYVIYTSGSTGNPKGVMVEHRNLMHIAEAWKQAYKLDSFDIRLLQLASISFDVFTGDLCRALLNGGRLIICPSEHRADIKRLYTLIKENEVNIFESTPGLIVPLMNYIRENELDISFMKLLIVGSDTFLMEDYRNLLLHYGNSFRIVNSYGTTETTIDSSFYESSYEELRSGAVVPIGKPLSNTQYYVLDSQKRVVPLGIPGELYIGGEGVARGYLNRPGLTEEKFIKNPFAEGSLYHTGDIARWGYDGNLEFIGRRDTQVKIRGYRIELEEIENILQRNEAIKKVIVLARENKWGEKYLVAYVLSDNSLDVDRLKRYSSKYLPEYMIPSYFIPVESFPLTPNGKMNHKALPDHQIFGTAPGEISETITQVEQKVIEIWEDLFDRKGLGVNDHFFKTGGNSLKAIQLVARINKIFNVEIPLRNVFTHPTVRELAEVIRALDEHMFKEVPVIEEQEYYDLSGGQKRLWILSQFEEEHLAYNMPAAFEFEGNLNAAAFEEAFNALIRRHEVLRTTFTAIYGEPRQIIHPWQSTKVSLKYLDLKGNPDLLKEIIEEEIRTSFDLANGPLVRATLIQKEEHKNTFLFNMHHIISDGWSADVLINDIITLYNAFNQGKSTPLHPLRIQYKEFVNWQQQQLAGQKLEKHKQYWINQFKENIPVVDFPADFARPLMKTYSGYTINTSFDTNILKSLKDLSHKHNVTLFITLMASIKAILYRYTGQEDLVIGTPVSGREHADFANQVGFYVNTLALRTKINGNESFEKLISNVKETTLKAFEHQIYPFEQLVDDLQLKRDTSRSPLFDIMLVFDQTSLNGKKLDDMDDVKVTEQRLDTIISKFDITFTFSEKENELSLNIEYNKDLFKEEKIQAFISHYQLLLRNIIGNSQVKLNKIEFLSDGERSQLLTDFNDTQKTYPIHITITELFELQAAKTPHSIVVRSLEGALTYQDLNSRANQLAWYLRKNYDIQSGDLAGIMVEKSEWLMIGILGILKAGAAYVPVDISYPTDRKRFIIEDSAIKVLLTENEYLDSLPVFNILNIRSAEIEKQAETNPPIINKEEDLIYVIYTSGTTGVPKGVQVEHKSVVNLSYWLGDIIYKKYNRPLVALLTASINFDASVQQLFAPLLMGAELVLIPDEIKKDPEHFLNLLMKYDVDVIDITPSYLNVLLTSLQERVKIPHIKHTLVGGEALSQGVITKYHTVFKGESELINVYGVTEATVNSTYEIAIGGTNENKSRLSTIGYPLANNEIYILDKHLNPVPVGVPGELCIGGAGVARGYLNRFELTREKFIPNPFKAGSLYRTGDVAKWMSDGNITYLGRNDHQVKIRGFRIELGEIENALLKHPDINDVALVCRARQEEKEIIAYLLTDQLISIPQMRNYLSESLPEYMFPAYFVPLESFPLTPNGKIDLGALPEPEFINISEKLDGLPKNAFEEKLIDIWCEVLGITRISTRDNFFESGGHSLKAVKLVALIAKKLNIKVTLPAVFIHPTIEQQARMISKILPQNQEPIEAIKEQEYYELSHAQKRLWVLTQSEGQAKAYNMSEAYLLEGNLSKDSLKMAFIALVERHESLRTIFKLVEGEPKQKILNAREVNIEIGEEDLSLENDPKHLAEQIISLEKDLAFDLQEAPLFRVKLFCIGEEQYIFFFNIHHIVADGWSTGVLIKEITASYSAIIKGEKSPLPLLHIQYKDYAAWQNKRLNENKLEPHKNFWMETLKPELPVINLPLDYPRPKYKTYRGDAFAQELDESTFKVLRSVAFENNTTFFNVLLTSIKVLLYRYTGQNDIIIGTPISGREEYVLHNQIGFYVNTIPVRTQLSGQETFKEVLSKVRQFTLKAFEFQEYPFDFMLDDLDIQWTADRSPMFDAMLVYKPMDFQAEIVFEDIKISSIKLNKTTTKFDLMFVFEEVENKLVVEIEYNKDLFAPESVCLMSDRLISLLNNIGADEAIRIEDLSFDLQEEDALSKTDLSNSFDFSF